MILKVFSIFDTATGAYNQPFFMLTAKEALRAFERMANDETSGICQNPSDYHLYYLGSYDNATGFINQDENIKNLGSADTFKNRDTNVQAIFEAKDQKTIEELHS